MSRIAGYRPNALTSAVFLRKSCPQRGGEMTTFEYVSVLLAIVISLAFTHLVMGMVRLIQSRGVKLSFVYLGWVGLLLFFCVDYWLSIWHARNADIWTLAFVAFLLLMVTVLYATCAFAVPEAAVSDGVNLDEFHRANRRKYLGALFVYTVLGFVGNLIISSLQLAMIVSAGQLVLIGVAWSWRDRRVQIAVLAAMYALTGWYAVTFIGAL